MMTRLYDDGFSIWLCGEDRWKVTAGRDGRWKAEFGGESGYSIGVYADSCDDLERNIFGLYQGVEFDGLGSPHAMPPDAVDLNNRVFDLVRKEKK